ncbi:MAG TPA: antibiotic biosynthesis monooxygenase [Chthoniobacteraceae bacterium]|nr:antibiotic biosynthesis monooxygenase [Chthoniobacteraceae bacterium]
MIFTSQRADGDRGYRHMADRMAELAAQQPGFLGLETVRGADGFGITVSYWTSLDAISNWKLETEHQAAQDAGKRVWYSDYELRISRVERAYGQARNA